MQSNSAPSSTSFLQEFLLPKFDSEFDSEFDSTTAAYVKNTLNRQQEPSDESKILAHLQLSHECNNAKSNSNKSNDPTVFLHDSEHEWFNYILARHRTAFE